MSAVRLVVVCALVLASVALGGGQSELITGLVDNQTLTEWSQYSPMDQSLLNPTNVDTQFLFLGSRLGCNGNVTKWTVGAGFGGRNRNVHPALGIYRLMNSVYERISSTVLNHTGLIGSRIYEVTLGLPKPFQTNDVLGIYLPANNVVRLRLLSQAVSNGPVYQTFAPSNPPPGGVDVITIVGSAQFQNDRLPLVAVEIESDDPDSANCTSDFLSRELLELLAPHLIQPSEQQIVFPSCTFTGNGSITGWTLAGEWVNEDGRSRFPELQIWRRRNDQSDVYDRVEKTDLSEIAESPNQLYSGTIDPPLEFQSGDVLGLYLPPDGSNGTRLLVHFGQNAGPVYEIRNTGVPLSVVVLSGAETNNHRPLLALEISAGELFLSTRSPTSASTTAVDNGTGGPFLPTRSSTSTVTVTTAVVNVAETVTTAPPTPSPSLSSPTEPPSLGIGGAIGVAIGSAIVGAVAVLILVAAVLCARKKSPVPKDRNVHVDAIDMTVTTDEVTYDSPFQQETTVPTKHNEAYASTAVSTAPNAAYGTACSGNTATADEYDYI